MKSGKKLQKAARKEAEKLPGVQVAHPFGPDYETYQVAGKIFLLLARVPRESAGQGIDENLRGKRALILKSDPLDAETLRGKYPEIGPGYHMNKKHWLTVVNGESIKKKLVQELVVDSYRLVVETLPKAEQPGKHS
ncbi:hypothetical protein COCCU_00430 [Corynebacterium occultum]|uniref:MmcQ/YjbR family DNA-binding protein n=1 Tax=Corynebacterium occultum TaxID=2675219 RepID=A0A6B8VXI6_9CORY|nr:MmcQ/YjbR family DNA-binding protein [Corynebacterium occultum]QGU06054.1 hypothetical protein COCCU_00430 [Corynebacterium occultum]